ncbi:MAG: ABC transporter ATP-binding protein [Chloroflexi bacterium]|nr:ABC transporter ATP-binding protein [Chloroflexota bacterium]
MIKTYALTKRFNGKTAVESLDLDVHEGEVFGFLGPNGAGKTTTVRMLACLIAPSSGEAIVNGFRVGQENIAIRHTTGILTESPGLYEKLSAEANLSFYAQMYEVENYRPQVEKYLRMLGLWERRDEPVAEFSKGMKQKLALARALIHEPKLLFLDEPTAALDPEAAKTVREFIEELRGEGRTIFLCTHNLDEAERLCDRIAVLRTRLIAVDTPENLRRRLFGRTTVVQVANCSDRFLKAVQELDFVQEVRWMDDKQMLIRLNDPERQNPIVVRQLATAGAEVQYVKELEHSLEEIYLALVKEDGR